MSDYIFVPRGNDQDSVGGFLFSEVIAHQFFPKEYKFPWDTEESKEARLVVSLKNKETTLNFFGLEAENLCSQIEEKLLNKK